MSPACSLNLAIRRPWPMPFPGCCRILRSPGDSVEPHARLSKIVTRSRRWSALPNRCTSTFSRANSGDPPRGSLMYSVDRVSDKAAFLAMEGEWNDAVERAAVPHPFLRHEWVRMWWEAFATDAQQIHILVVRRGSTVCAIAPLMFERVHMYGMPVRRIRFLQNDHTPRTDVIVADNVEDSYRALWHGVHDSSSHWDVLLLSQIPGDSISRDKFRQLASAEGR